MDKVSTDKVMDKVPGKVTEGVKRAGAGVSSANTTAGAKIGAAVGGHMGGYFPGGTGVGGQVLSALPGAPAPWRYALFGCCEDTGLCEL